MPVPLVISDLSTTALSNSPAGADNVTTVSGPDDYLRALAAIVRREQAQGASIASAAALDLGATTDGNYIHITGITAITSLGTVAAGIERTVVFDGMLRIFNSASLILPTGTDIVTAAGDTARFISEGAGIWRCVAYTATATNTTNIPAGNIAATNVQAALNELDAEKALLAGSLAQGFSVNNLNASGTGTFAGTVSMANASAAGHGVTLGQFARSLAANGYHVSPGGLIIQWGLSSVVTGTPLTITFPLAFPFAATSVNATLVSPSNSLNGVYITTSASLTSFSANVTGTAGSSGLYWIATGY